MRTPSRRLLLGFLILALSATSMAPIANAYIQAPDVLPKVLEGVGIDQKLNQQVPIHLAFKDETGKTVHLSDYLGKKPAILVMAYYLCPRLCTLVLNGVGDALSQMKLHLGKDFQIITVSINPQETPEIAAKKKASYIKEYGKSVATGWHFLTGTQASITQLADAVGYHYKPNPKQKGEFLHATDIMILTPGGKISHYFFGIRFPGRDVRLALVQASDGKIGNPVDKFLLYCCSIDLTTGKYTASIWKIMQVMGTMTVIMLAGLIIFLMKYNPKKTA